MKLLKSIWSTHSISRLLIALILTLSFGHKGIVAQSVPAAPITNYPYTQFFYGSPSHDWNIYQYCSIGNEGAISVVGGAMKIPALGYNHCTNYLTTPVFDLTYVNAISLSFDVTIQLLTSNYSNPDCIILVDDTTSYDLVLPYPIIGTETVFFDLSQYAQYSTLQIKFPPTWAANYSIDNFTFSDGSNETDIALNKFTFPEDDIPAGPAQNVSVEIINHNSSSAQISNICLQIDNDSLICDNVQLTILGGDTVVHSFNYAISDTSSFTKLKSWIENPFSSNANNDTIFYFNNSCSNPISYGVITDNSISGTPIPGDLSYAQPTVWFEFELDQNHEYISINPEDFDHPHFDYEIELYADCDSLINTPNPITFWNGLMVPDMTPGIYQVKITSSGNAQYLFRIGSKHYGCYDPEALNYDSTANISDGSCYYPGDSCSIAIDYGLINGPAVTNSMQEHLQEKWHFFTLDQAYTDVKVSMCGSIINTSIDVYDGCNGNLILPGPSGSVCSDNKAKLNFPFLDAGNYWVKLTAIGWPNSWPIPNWTGGEYTLTIFDAPEGCTDPDAVNYDPLATADNFSCYFEGDSCTIPLQYGLINDPVLTGHIDEAIPDRWIAFTLDQNYNDVVISAYGTGYHTELEIYDDCGGIILYNSLDNQPCSNSIGTQIILPSLNAGDYKLLLKRVATANMVFPKLFKINVYTQHQGCTNMFALNFDPYASVDDGSCYFTGDSCQLAIDYGNINDYRRLGMLSPNDTVWYSFELDDDYANIAVRLYDVYFNSKIEILDNCDGTVLFSSDTCYDCTGQYDTKVDIPFLNTGTYLARVTRIGSVGYGEGYSFYVNSIAGCLDPLADNYNEFATYSDSVCVYTPAAWNYTNTGQNHTVLLFANSVTVNGQPLEQGDAIGAFYYYNGVLKCAGTANVINVNANNSISVWGNDVTSQIKDGFDPGETFNWKIYRQAENMIYDAVATYSQDFLSFDTYQHQGLSAITALSSVTYTNQTIDLTKGWSYISTYVDPTINDLDSIFKDIVADVLLMKDENGNVFWPIYQVDQLSGFTIGEAYQLNMSSAHSIDVAGVQIQPESTYIQLTNSWSLMAYLRDTPGDITQMFNSIQQQLTIVKDKTGVVYWPLYNVNMIGSMIPGDGYQIKTSAACSFSYPPNSVDLQLNKQLSLNTQLNKNTGQNMTLGLEINHEAINGDIEIYSTSGLLIGKATPQSNFTSITLWGDDESTTEIDGLLNGESFLIRTSTGQEIRIEEWIEGNETYSNNAIAVAKKISITDQANFMLFGLQPNPFKSSSTFKFYLPEQSDVLLYVYDLTGKIVDQHICLSLAAGNQSFSYNSKELSAGTYYYKLITKTDMASGKMQIIK